MTHQQTGRREFVTPVCSYKPRPSVQSNRRFGAPMAEWKRDPLHLLGDGDKTLCGIKTYGWIKSDPRPLAEATADPNCCSRCKAVAEKQTEARA